MEQHADGSGNGEQQIRHSRLGMHIGRDTRDMAADPDTHRKLNVRGVHHADAWSEWHWIAPLVAKSCERGGDKYLSGDVLKAIENRDWQLWVAPGAFAITEIINYPRKRILRLEIGGGKNYKQHFEEFLSIAEAWGKSNGCHGAEVVTREGYSPAFKACGWRKTQVYMEKEL